MAQSGVNNTAKWSITDRVLTIEPVSGTSGKMVTDESLMPRCNQLWNYIDITQSEMDAVNSIVIKGSISFWSTEIMSDDLNKTHIIFCEPFGSIDEKGFTKVDSIDVTGLDITDVDSLFWMFYGTHVKSITGLDKLDTSAVSNYSYMFSDTDISRLDLSSFHFGAKSNVEQMINNCPYLKELVLPNDFEMSYASPGADTYNFGISEWTINGNIRATNTRGVTVTSDENFFRLPSGQQGGKWVRDISSSAVLTANVKEINRVGLDCDITLSYATENATLEVYVKETIESSFPSQPIHTESVQGSGVTSFTIQLATDGSYDLMVIVSDGNTNLYLMPSVDSNILLFDIDDQGNVNVKNDIKIRNKPLCDIIYPIGSIYMSMEATNPSQLFGGSWERIGVGRMLISAGGGDSQVIDDNTYKGRGQVTGVTTDTTSFPVGETGGELDHTLSVAEIPSHSHDANIGSKDAFASGKSAGYKAATGAKTTGKTGGDGKHNNVPPYLAVYMWKRTA
ncbi:MAG: BspA family leucine-rich repeat surface protein [Bacillota bacterium]|nr:BspA family leucine-rich repeat surface protein [Bacillota bacterium]